MIILCAVHACSGERECRKLVRGHRGERHVLSKRQLRVWTELPPAGSVAVPHPAALTARRQRCWAAADGAGEERVHHCLLARGHHDEAEAAEDTCTCPVSTPHAAVGTGMSATGDISSRTQQRERIAQGDR